MGKDLQRIEEIENRLYLQGTTDNILKILKKEQEFLLKSFWIMREMAIENKIKFNGSDIQTFIDKIDDEFEKRMIKYSPEEK